MEDSSLNTDEAIPIEDIIERRKISIPLKFITIKLFIDLKFIDYKKHLFAFIYIINIFFYICIIVIAIVIFLFILSHIIYIFTLLPYPDFIIKHFNIMEKIFNYSVIEISIAYILLMIILTDITTFIIPDHLFTVYSSYKTIKTIKPDDDITLKNNHSHKFGHIFLIIFSAILFELFLKLFSCENIDDIRNIAILITGTLLAGSFFIYVIYEKVLKYEEE